MFQGHYDEILSVCVPISPREPHQIFTAGRDGAIAVFNTATKRPVWKHVIKVIIGISMTRTRKIVYRHGTLEDFGNRLTVA